MTSIGIKVFDGCRNLVDVTLSDEILIIRRGAFAGCTSLKRIIIPPKVEFIYQEAFDNCGLEELKVQAETPPFAFDNTFSNYNIPLYVPEASISTYQSTNPWSKFSEFKKLTESDTEIKKCATPTINYYDGNIAFGCETKDVVYSSTISNTDIKSYNTPTIQLGVTYIINVFASKNGYEDSDVATATLCWIDSEPTMEGIIDAVLELKAFPILIQSYDGIIKLSGITCGTDIKVFNLAGTVVGSGTSTDTVITIRTNLKRNETAILKIGEKTIKTVIR